MPLDSAALRARLSGVRDRIARAALRAGRDPASVTLVAISKTFPPDAVRATADAGQIDFGENKVQEALVKIGAVDDGRLRWHLVGHLQSNKARKAAERFDVIHSVDSPALLLKIDEAARAGGRTIDVLIQVDLAGESTKYGTPAEGVPAILEVASGCRGCRVIGLMTLPPAVENPDSARPYFAALRSLRDRFAGQHAALTELSMGMSDDFEVAIEEGATMVRVGSAIFGERSQARP